MLGDNLTSQVLALPLAVQAALGLGYLGYVIAFVGRRSAHRVEDTIFVSLAFGSVAYLTMLGADLEAKPLIGLSAAAAAIVIVAIAWRVVVQPAALWMFRRAKVSDFDVHATAWAGFLDAVNIQRVHQATVHLHDGRALFCSACDVYADHPLGRLYLGSDGGVALVVDVIRHPDGREEDLAEEVRADGWGLRVTFVPPEQIARLELRQS